MLGAYVFAIMSPRNNKLASSLNFFDVSFFERFFKVAKKFKISKSGQKKVKLKGYPTFRLLTPVAKVT